MSKDRGCVAGYASFSVSYSVCVPFVSMCNSSVEGEDGQGGNEIESSSGDMTRKRRQDKTRSQSSSIKSLNMDVIQCEFRPSSAQPES